MYYIGGDNFFHNLITKLPIIIVHIPSVRLIKSLVRLEQITIHLFKLIYSLKKKEEEWFTLFSAFI